MKSTKLTLAVSTLGTRINQALNVFEALSPRESVEFLLLVQGATPDMEGVSCPDSVRIEYLDSIGLSHSRNAALQKSKGDFVWFLDDDVIINDADLEWLTSQLNDQESIYIGQIRCSDCDKLYKDYSRSRKGKLGALRTSSIEIIATRHALTNYKITFNPHVGLGTKLPSGEENLFLIDVIRSGLNIKHLNQTIIAHPCLQEERSPRIAWKNEGLVKSKGIIAKHVGGLTGFALACWWGARATYYNLSLIGMVWVLTAFLRKNSLISRSQDNSK